jgi:hypothetical protein
LLHPDVPGTGDARAFVAVKEAYDVVGNADRRAAYDLLTRRPAFVGAEAAPPPVQRPAPTSAPPIRNPRFAGPPLALWAFFGAMLVVGVYEVAVHLMALAPVPAVPTIAATAPSVPPQTPAERQLAANPEAPRQLAGVPNYYVIPAAGVTVLWRIDQEKKALVPAGRLPPFSAVQAVRLYRQNGLFEVKVTDTANGFVQAARLAPGDANAARNAYCAYNAGAPPTNGEVLRQIGSGPGHLALENRTAQPVVVKLRDEAGGAILSTYLAPGGHARIDGLPEGRYRPDYAIGEFWSRACARFAAGMRAARMADFVALDALTPLTIPPDHPGAPPPSDIPDETFHRD